MKRAQIFSTASADAQIPAEVGSHPEATSDKIATDETKKPKPQRYNKATRGRRGGASYSKVPRITSLQIVPRRATFPIFTSNHGCYALSAQVYRTMQGKDYRLANNITHDQLAYVTTIAFCNRVVQTAYQHGYAFPVHSSQLKQIAAGIQLPSVLAKYIESLGAVELASGVTVAPMVRDYGEWFRHPQMMDPAQLLRDNGRQDFANEWALDVNWIVEYNDATTRASRSGMNFRTVDNSTYTGTAEMLVSYRTIAPHVLTPYAPQIMSEAEAQLGAAYRFRDRSTAHHWGENRELLFDAFTAIPFDSRTLVSDMCVAAFKGSIISKD